jgi:stage II sporulation protein D
MKQVLYLTILLLVIPFLVVIITLKEVKEKKPLEVKENKVFVRLKREETGNIEKIALEDYVVGVLAGEMPISFHIEALKAQAVAARSYVLKRLESSKNNDYDVVDSTTNQVFLDDNYLKGRWQEKYDENVTKLRKAVSETKMQYITYNGEIADALFFSTSNGFTEDSEDVFSAEIPYLRSVESVWDEKTSPVFKDQKSYSLTNFLNLLGLNISTDLKIEIIEKSETNHVLKISINGVEMKGTDVRDKLKLRSSDFEIIKENNNIIIKTTGYGHDVGMSQYGALGMANDGYTYDEILKHYYLGVSISTLNSK